MNGMTALRLSLPYHDSRMPPELHRADYIVSANVARTVQVCRQAVLDARRAIAWLHAEGYERIGILGSSLGSCLSLLTMAHEPLIDAAGAESRVAVFRRRRLARAVDRARAGRPRRPHRARAAARVVGTDFSRRGISNACAIARRCWCTRNTISRSRSTCPRISCGCSASATSLTRSRCCTAATTRPGRRRSSSWTDGFCRGSFEKRFSERNRCEVRRFEVRGAVQVPGASCDVHMHASSTRSSSGPAEAGHCFTRQCTRTKHAARGTAPKHPRTLAPCTDTDQSYGLNSRNSARRS